MDKITLPHIHISVVLAAEVLLTYKIKPDLLDSLIE